MRSRLKVWVGVMCALLLVGGGLFGRFTSHHVCQSCGAIAHDTEWQIPLTSVTLFHGDKITRSTPVSNTLGSLHLIPQGHSHEWLLAHGTGNGIMCALGSGGPTLMAVDFESIAELIRATHDSGDVAFRDRLIRCVFDRKTAGGVISLAITAPHQGFNDATTFSAWRKEQSARIEEFLPLEALDKH